MKSLGNFRGAFLVTLCAATVIIPVPAAAQTSSPTLTGLSALEQSISISNVLPNAAANLPPNVLASVTAGGLDLRAQTNYNPSANLLTMTFFTAAPGSPSPANLGQVNPLNIYGSLTLGVDRIYATSKVIMFVGTVSSGGSSVFGSLQGAPATFAFAYSSDTPPKLTNVSLSVAGTLVFFSPTATGNVTIVQPPSTGGGTGSGASGVTVAVSVLGSPAAGPNVFQVSQNQVLPDASKSTSTNPGPLTYSWTIAPSSLSAVIINSTSATPIIEVNVKGTYLFTVTVTDATGATAAATITIQYT